MKKLSTRIKKHYLPLLIVSFITTVIFHYTWSNLQTIQFITRTTGYIGLFLIGFTLIIGPVNLILKQRNPISSYFRRDIGIFGGSIAVIHSVAGLFVHLKGQMWKYFLDKTAEGYGLKFDDFRLANYTGLIAALLILGLLITSNDLAVRKLTLGKWKNFQRMAYIVFLLITAHAVFYKLVSETINEVFFLYLPFILLILAFQLTGITLRIKHTR